MDINKTPPSDYKASELRSSLTSPSSKFSQAPQDISRFALKEGQMIKGEIINLRSSYVTIRLEPGNQVINARLEGNLPLAIGQTAQFQVAKDAADQLTLKYVPTNMQSSTEAMIEKAITASGLPLTSHNKSLVTLLLNTKMSIDKQTLQSMVKLSHQHRDTAPLTLVLMHKYNIPITKENITQFEAYANGTNQTLSLINELLNNMKELLPIAENSGSAINPPLLNITDIITNAITEAPEAFTNPSLPGEITNPLTTLLSEEDRITLATAIEQQVEASDHIAADIPDNLIARIYNGSIPLSEVVPLLTDLFQNGQNVISVDGMYHSLPDSNPAATVVTNLIQQYNNVINNTSEVKIILSLQQRVNLLEYVKAFHEASSISTQIEDGTARISDVLRFIKNGIASNIASGDIISTQNLLQSPEYARLLTGAFHEKWMVSPEKLRDKDTVTQLYETLEKDMDHLSHLINPSKDAIEAGRIQEPAKNMQQNLSFLKDLNQMFTYLPLPLQFKNQDAHCDLYILAKKKALKNPKDGLNILLNLDMANLGPLNIHVHMEGKQILAKFCLEDAIAGQLLTKHMHSLTSTLRKIGYNLHAEVVDTYKEPDFVQDFIEQDTLDMDIQRYAFDIRT